MSPALWKRTPFTSSLPWQEVTLSCVLVNVLVQVPLTLLLSPRALSLLCSGWLGVCTLRRHPIALWTRWCSQFLWRIAMQLQVHICFSSSCQSFICNLIYFCSRVRFEFRRLSCTDGGCRVELEHTPAQAGRPLSPDGYNSQKVRIATAVFCRNTRVAFYL